MCHIMMYNICDIIIVNECISRSRLQDSLRQRSRQAVHGHLLKQSSALGNMATAEVQKAAVDAEKDRERAEEE